MFGFNDAIDLATQALNDVVSQTEQVVDAVSEKLNAVSKAVKLTYSNGDHFEGEACAGTRHGYGVYQHAGKEGRYEGEFVDNEKYGSGAFFFIQGDVYDGQWYRGKQHGRGTMVHWSPQEGVWVYEGDFCDGQRSGSGALLAREQGALIGSWSTGGFKSGVEFRSGCAAQPAAQILAVSSAPDSQDDSQATPPSDGEGMPAALGGGDSGDRCVALGASPKDWELKAATLWFQVLGLGTLPQRTVSSMLGDRLLSLQDADYQRLAGQSEGAEQRQSQSWVRTLALARAALDSVGREDGLMLHSWEEMQAAIPSLGRRLIPSAELAAGPAEISRPAQACEWRGMLVEVYALPMRFATPAAAAALSTAAGGGGEAPAPTAAEADAVAAHVARSWARDLEALAAARHPNVRALLGVAILPVEGDAGATALTLVYESSRNSKMLFEWIHAVLPDGGRQSLNFRTELRLCIGILDALASLAEKGLVCSALSSVNVEVVPDSYDVTQPKARLLRCGTSWWRWGWRRSLRVRDAGPPRRRALSMEEVVMRYGLCPLNWLAPEVLRGESPKEAADIYSFGLVLWEMLYRAIPYGEFSIAQIIGAVGYGRRRLQVAASPGASAETSFLHEVVGRCTQRNPDKRPRASVLSASLKDMLRSHEQRRAKKSTFSKLGDKTEAFIAKRVLSDGLQRSLYGSDLGKSKKGVAKESDESEGPRLVRLETGEWVRVDMDLVQQFPGDEEKWRMLMALRARLSS